MKIRISSLREGSNRWQEELTPELLELEGNSFGCAVIVDYLVDKRQSRLEVDLSAHTLGDFACDRCGETFRSSVSGEISVIFVQRESPLPDEMPGDDMRSYRPGQEEVDVASEIRDALLLSLPMKLLCKSDCRGLCPRCGADLNTDQCRCPAKTDASVTNNQL